ncbi:MAG: L-asparaginase [Rhodobacteraceae bacterium]|nr:L-asparaginase [Paracoccaceae bacterium]
MSRPKVALIGTGGTISSLGADGFDSQDYGRHGRMMTGAQVLEMFPRLSELAEIVPVDFPPIPSTAMEFGQWKMLVEKIDDLAADPEMAGVVILHGTASMEETAYALTLSVKSDLPVVITGAQRPASAISTDAEANMIASIRTVLSPEARGLGVLVCLNEEIQAAREVTKTSVWRLQTFRTPDFGALGHADVHGVAVYRHPVRRHTTATEFDIRSLEALPRVDISYCYAGVDGAAVRAFVAAGAKGIVSAGFAPGMTAPLEHAALAEAVSSGVTVIQSTRAGSGRVANLSGLRNTGILPGDNLNPQKARILLAFALSVTEDPTEIARIFATY